MNIIKGNFDTRVKGMCVCSCEPDGDFYTIVINDNASYEAQNKALEHELLHIGRDDFHSDKNASEIEREVHNACL